MGCFAEKKEFGNTGRFGLILFVALILLWSAASATTVFGDSNAPYNQGIKAITVDTKSHDGIQVSTYEFYTVSRRTLIIGTEEKQIDFDQMPVPCEADVLYVEHNGKRRALEIRIKYVQENATTLFQAGKE